MRVQIEFSTFQLRYTKFQAIEFDFYNASGLDLEKVDSFTLIEFKILFVFKICEKGSSVFTRRGSLVLKSWGY